MPMPPTKTARHYVAALPEWGRGSRLEWHGMRQKNVWTMSTLWASDRVVHRSDRAGFRMFPGESSVCKGWNAVRVPPRAQHSPSSEGFLL
jgi:hypothetical protein